MANHLRSKTLKKNIFIILCAGLTISFLAISCVYKKPKGPESPIGYDINKPTKYNMPEILLEISGIAFDKGKNDFIYAEQDEDGSLYRLPLGSKEEISTKFAKKGDYEDVAIAKGWAIVLKSNGKFFSFPLTEINNPETKNVVLSEDIIPKGEYEGMFADETTGNVYVLCKDCKVDKGTKNTSGYILTLQENGSLKFTGNFTIDVSNVDKISGKKKGTFHPSALAVNPLTKEWFIISSVNKALIITDANFKIKDVFHLSSNTFNQPEGIAFDSAGNLYISNEGSETQNGNILRFDCKKP